MDKHGAWIVEWNSKQSAGHVSRLEKRLKLNRGWFLAEGKQRGKGWVPIAICPDSKQALEALRQFRDEMVKWGWVK